MKKKLGKNFYIAICSLVSFVVWTILICFIDVKAIGPLGTTVGFATINKYIHNLTGVHLSLYTITDYLGLVPFMFIIGFALLGLFQWIKRRHIKRVDFSIFVLGGFYIVTMAVYILFEIIVINYRPILINGYLEASYPSSTTLLVMCVMPTATMQFNTRLKNKVLKKIIFILISAFTIFMVVLRIFSGVHWFTDIMGGAMLSTGLIMMYRYIISLQQK